MAEPLHAFVPGEPRQRQRHVEAEDLAGGAFHEPLDHPDHVVGLDERHLHIELREFGLPVGAEVFVPEALRHLHVAVEARHHQELRVELRRLGQGEERAVVEPAGHEIVAGPFGRAAAEHRRLHVDEAECIEVVAHDLHDPAAQEHVVLHRGPPEVEPAIRQPDLLSRKVGRPGLEDGGLRLVEHVQRGAGHFDSTRGELGVGGALGPSAHRAVDAQHPLRPHEPGRGQRLGRTAGADHHLRASPAVAEVDEDHSLVVADTIHPAAERDLLAEIRGTQFSTGVTS